ncbi:MAG TPA: tRNA (guanine(10)-N(2))-dimethyltransferase [Candidatus Korarchaeota archaeon]|nr:tRNA (guanine(10)-N(2))-dimethyltransferase [Candidatus Korarchaeota archaeon]
MEERKSIDLKLYTEGKAKFYASDLDRLERLGLDYTSAEIFYNPRMVVNRDIAVAVLRWLVSNGKDTALDLMAASGVRALRFALETSVSRVLANDRNPLCVAIIRRNVLLNSLRDKVRVSCCDANLLAEKLSVEGNRYWMVDLDPFGSPVPFLSSTMKTVRNEGILAVTATDEPPLFGIKRDKLLRAYGVWGKKTEYCKEFGLRVLIGYAIREAAKHDLVARPILGHVTGHYVRIYLSLYRGAEEASELMKEEMGWIEQCFNCGNMGFIRGMSEIPEKGMCLGCGSELVPMGPLWVGDFVDVEIAKEVLEELPKESAGFKTSNKILTVLIHETELPPFFYSLEKVASRLKLPTPSTNDVIRELRSLGYRAVRSHISDKGVKTDAPISQLREIISHLSGKK